MSGSARQSLTLIAQLTDADACARELGLRSRALATGWARVRSIQSACLAELPRLANTPSALLFECSFDGDLSDLAGALWRELGPDLTAVLAHCAGYGAPEGPGALRSFLRSRARRATPLTLPSGAVVPTEHPYRAAWRRAAQALAGVRPLFQRRTREPPRLDPDLLEARRAAIGWQESEPGVPLLHVAEVLPGEAARARLKRALRALEPSSSPQTDIRARFLLADDRLVLLAYPKERPAPFSERLSRELGSALARVWAQTEANSYLGPFIGRPLRRRRIERFVLGSRVPVAAWFNAG